jgi:molecular chaperone GrpE
MKKEANTPTENIDEKFLTKITELTNDLQRTRADFENYRKQVEAQKQSAENAAKLATVYKVLPLLDDIDRAIATYQELAPLAKSLEKTLSELSLAKINSAEGTDFNPDLHDAISMDDGDGAKEVISETLRPGYYYGKDVLRPAMVRVKRV